MLSQTSQPQSYTQRQTVDLTQSKAIERVLMDERRQQILSEFTTQFYENQERVGNRVMRLFAEHKEIVNVMVVARTQSGKTGFFCAVIQKMMESRHTYVPLEHIYIISGVSSTEWKEQTQARLPTSLRGRVFHRGELNQKKFQADFARPKKNVFIIFDEVQVAALESQTIHQMFKKHGLHDLQHLYADDIKILEISATPDGTFHDLMKWGPAGHFMQVGPGRGYTSAADFLRQNRVRQSRDWLDRHTSLSKSEKGIAGDWTDGGPFDELKADVQSFVSPKYHIIRCAVGENTTLTIELFTRHFPRSSHQYLLFDQNSPCKDINEVISAPPPMHTFIFLKEMLRCSKTLFKPHLGVLYERWSSYVQDSVVIQGLIGRCTGYDDPGHTIIYTNVESIENYEKLWRAGFNKESIKWVSNTTRFAYGKTRASATFLTPKDPVVVVAAATTKSTKKRRQSRHSTKKRKQQITKQPKKKVRFVVESDEEEEEEEENQRRQQQPKSNNRKRNQKEDLSSESESESEPEEPEESESDFEEEDGDSVEPEGDDLDDFVDDDIDDELENEDSDYEEPSSSNRSSSQTNINYHEKLRARRLFK